MRLERVAGRGGEKYCLFDPPQRACKLEAFDESVQDRNTSQLRNFFGPPPPCAPMTANTGSSLRGTGWPIA